MDLFVITCSEDKSTAIIDADDVIADENVQVNDEVKFIYGGKEFQGVIVDKGKSSDYQRLKKIRDSMKNASKKKKINKPANGAKDDKKSKKSSTHKESVTKTIHTRSMKRLNDNEQPGSSKKSKIQKSKEREVLETTKDDEVINVEESIEEFEDPTTLDVTAGRDSTDPNLKETEDTDSSEEDDSVEKKQRKLPKSRRKEKIPAAKDTDSSEEDNSVEKKQRKLPKSRRKEKIPAAEFVGEMFLYKKPDESCKLLQEKGQIYVDKKLLFSAKNAKTGGSMARQLMDGIFTKHAMAVCSLKGGSANGKGKGGMRKPGLDKDAVKEIQEFVMKRLKAYPDRYKKAISLNDLSQYMRVKLGEEANKTENPSDE